MFHLMFFIVHDKNNVSTLFCRLGLVATIKVCYLLLLLYCSYVTIDRLDSFYAYIGLLIILLATNFIVFYMHLKHVKSIVFFYVSVVLLGLAHTIHLLFFRYIFFTYNNYYREDHLGPQLF